MSKDSANRHHEDAFTKSSSHESYLKQAWWLKGQENPDKKPFIRRIYQEEANYQRTNVSYEDGSIDSDMFFPEKWDKAIVSASDSTSDADDEAGSDMILQGSKATMAGRISIPKVAHLPIKDVWDVEGLLVDKKPKEASKEGSHSPGQEVRV